MRKYFSIILSIVFILVFNACSQKKKSAGILSLPLEKIIYDEVQDTLKTNFDKSKVVHLLFYSLKDQPYLILSTASGYSKSRLKRHCLLRKDILIVYNGFNDSLANKYMKLNKMFIAKVNPKYENFDECNCGYDPNFPSDERRQLGEASCWVRLRLCLSRI